MINKGIEGAAPLKSLLPELVKIAIAAGKEILEVYKRPALWEVEQKADSSPLTLADRRAHQYIVRALESLPEGYPVLSEESKEEEDGSILRYENRKTLDYFWLIDPLDGTKEFLKRNGEFTVNIALIAGNRSVLGVVHVPVSGETYAAAEGLGAWLQTDRGRQRLRAAVFDPEAQPLRVVCSRSHLNEPTRAFIERFPTAKRVSVGSSLKFLLIARGEAEVYPRLAPTMEWDTAAAQIILEEAGGSVVEWEGQGPLRYNKASLLNPFFVAYGRRSPSLAPFYKNTR